MALTGKMVVDLPDPFRIVAGVKVMELHDVLCVVAGVTVVDTNKRVYQWRKKIKERQPTI